MKTTIKWISYDNLTNETGHFLCLGKDKNFDRVNIYYRKESPYGEYVFLDGDHSIREDYFAFVFPLKKLKENTNA